MRERFPDNHEEHQVSSLEEARAVIEALRASLASKEDELNEVKKRVDMDPLLESMLNQGAAKRELERRVGEGLPFGVWIVDIDKFKLYNDTYDHEEGNQLLYLLEELLQANFKRDDDNCTLARIGGDEFLLMIMIDLVQDGRRSPDPHQQMENVREIILRQRVEAEMLRREPRAAAIGVGLSVGCAIFNPDEPVSAQELKKRADAAMYEDKRQRHGNSSSR